MADTDGRDLAKSFYKALFSSEAVGVPYALRAAAQKLWEKGGITLERWDELCAFRRLTVRLR